MALVERMISPLSRYLGFKTDLELEPLLAKVPGFKVEKVEGVNLFSYWKVVEGVNNKYEPVIKSHESHMSSIETPEFVDSKPETACHAS